jgi:Flp pilus assembly protein TadG
MFIALRSQFSHLARRPRFKLLRRFGRDRKGATAVEFALVATPFLGMLFAIVETALVFFAGQTLETAAGDSARKILTGQAKDWSQERFKQEVCGRIFGLFDCGKIHVNVQAYSSFSSANMSRPMDANGNIVDAFNPGNAGDVVVARLLYEWPVYVSMLGLNTPGMGNKRLLVATVAFRNEPF